MSESPEQREQRECREFEAKNVEHYSVLLQAWVDNRMEGDRTIVTLSAAAIGVLATLLTTVGVKHSGQIYLYAGAFAGFLVATFASLIIYRRNTILLEQEIRGSSAHDPMLVHYDRTQMAAFMLGAALSAWIGIDSAIARLNGDAVMNDKVKPSAVQLTNHITGDSLHGIGRMAPQERSLSGIAGLKPQAPTQQPTSEASTQSQGQPAASQPASGGAAQEGGSK